MITIGLLTGCNGGDAGSSTDMSHKAEPVQPTSSSPPTAPPAPSTSQPSPVASSQAPNTATAQAAAVETCPWDLKNDAVFANYRSIGVEIQVDCEGIEKSNAYSHPQASDFTETLKVLERTFGDFKNWSRRPTKIVLGYRGFHSSKDNLIQLPYYVSRPSDLEDYLHDTRLLMDLEIADFNRQVRFSYMDYDMGRRSDGEMFNAGGGHLMGYGVERASIVKSDIARARTLKKQILQAPHKNVRLTHANQFGSFLVDSFDDAYTLPTEYSDAQLAPYFKYLAKLATVQKSFGEVKVVVHVPAYPALKIESAIRALDILEGSREVIAKLGVRAVRVTDPNLAALQFRFRVSKNIDVLTVENLYDSEGKSHSATELNSCIQKANLKSGMGYFCDGLGDLRY